MMDTETTTVFAVVLNTPNGKKTITTSSGAKTKSTIAKAHCAQFAKDYSKAYYGDNTSVTVEDAYYYDKVKRYIDL